MVHRARRAPRQRAPLPPALGAPRKAPRRAAPKKRVIRRAAPQWSGQRQPAPLPPALGAPGAPPPPPGRILPKPFGGLSPEKWASFKAAQARVPRGRAPLKRAAPRRGRAASLGGRAASLEGQAAPRKLKKMIAASPLKRAAPRKRAVAPRQPAPLPPALGAPRKRKTKK